MDSVHDLGGVEGFLNAAMCDLDRTRRDGIDMVAIGEAIVANIMCDRCDEE